MSTSSALRAALLALVVLLAACTGNEGADGASDAATESAAAGDRPQTPLEAFDGLLVHSAVDGGGEPTGEVVVSLPDGTELYRLQGPGQQAFAAATGVPGRAWLVAPDVAGAIGIGLLDLTAPEVIDLGLPPSGWQVPPAGSVRADDQRAVLLLSGVAAVLVDLVEGTATQLTGVDAPVEALLAPDGATVLVVGDDEVAIVNTEDPTRVAVLEDLAPLGWLDGGGQLLVATPLGTGILDLAGSTVTPTELTDVLATVPGTPDRVLLDRGGELVVSGLDGAGEQVLGAVVEGPVVVDPGGASAVVPTADGVTWVDLASGEVRTVAEAGATPISRPGPAGPRVAWYADRADPLASLVAVDLATGDAVQVAPADADPDGDGFDLSTLRLSTDWRSAVVALAGVDRTDLVHVSMDRPASAIVAGLDVAGSLSPDRTVAVVSRTDGTGPPVISIRGTAGSLVLEVGPGRAPLWVPVR